MSTDRCRRYDGIEERVERLERVGRWAEAERLCAAEFDANLERGDVRTALGCLRRQARICNQNGSYEVAEDLASLSIAIAAAHGLAVDEARGLNVLAVTHYHRRAWPLASQLFQEALDRSVEVGDHDLAALACQNLGVIANIRGDLREAKLRYLEALGAALRTDDPRPQAMAYNNLGMACADRKEWIEADLHFSRAAELAARGGDGVLLAMVRANHAEPLLKLGDLDRTRHILRLAQEVSQGATAVTRIDLLRFSGMLAREEGDLERALIVLGEARALAVEATLPLERAEVRREEAYTLEKAQRHAEAVAAMEEALALFRGIEAARDVRDCEEWLARRNSASTSGAVAVQGTAAARPD